MKRLAALLLVTVSLSADAGKASGKFVVGDATRRLTHAYVVEKDALLRIILATDAVEEAALYDDAALQSAVAEQGLSALVIQLDEDRGADATYVFDKDLPAGLEVRETGTFKAGKSRDGALSGRVVLKDDDVSFSYDATFDAPILMQQQQQVEPPAANVDTANALRRAIDLGKPEAVKLLLAGGADKNAKDAYGQSLVMMATSNHRADVVAMLIAAGADINAANDYHITPLAVAAEQGHLDLVNMLVAAGANVNARDTAGGTALAVAILRGYQPIVAALLEAGTDVQRDKDDLLALAADKPEIKAMLEAAMKK